MNKRKIYYLLHSGKNSKLAYYIKVYLQEITPRCLLRPFLSHLLQEAEKRSDYDYIMERVNYYNRLTKDIVFSQDDWQKEAVCPLVSWSPIMALGTRRSQPVYDIAISCQMPQP